MIETHLFIKAIQWKSITIKYKVWIIKRTPISYNVIENFHYFSWFYLSFVLAPLGESIKWFEPSSSRSIRIIFHVVDPCKCCWCRSVMSSRWTRTRAWCRKSFSDRLIVLLWILEQVYLHFGKIKLQFLT